MPYKLGTSARIEIKKTTKQRLEKLKDGSWDEILNQIIDFIEASYLEEKQRELHKNEIDSTLQVTNPNTTINTDFSKKNLCSVQCTNNIINTVKMKKNDVSGGSFEDGY